MIWNYLLYGFLSFSFSICWYLISKKWKERKERNMELDGYDKGTIIPRDWLITICFGIMGIIYFLKFLFE